MYKPTRGRKRFTAEVFTALGSEALEALALRKRRCAQIVSLSLLRTAMSYPLEPPRPVDIFGLQALAFYAPGTGPTPWDIRCASACLANFFFADEKIAAPVQDSKR